MFQTSSGVKRSLASMRDMISTTRSAEHQGLPSTVETAPLPERLFQLAIQPCSGLSVFGTSAKGRMPCQSMLPSPFAGRRRSCDAWRTGR